MLNVAQHILIINYDFPPNEGIGGRRWAKFSKQLAAEGFTIHVIKADPIRQKSKSPWGSDVSHPNILIHSLPRKYPSVLSHPGAGIVSKISYRIHKLKVQLTHRGTIYDVSIGWKKLLQEKMRELISAHKIINVIASGAPWQMLADVAELKQAFPTMNLIIDYRDPWLTAVNYGMQGLSQKRRTEEERKQSLVLENASVVTSPYLYLTEALKNWSKEHCTHQAKFNVLTHFFDPDDLPQIPVSLDKNLTLVYGGDLYQGMERELYLLRDELFLVKKNNPALYSKIRIRIFTNQFTNSIFSGLDCVEVLQGIGKKIFSEIKAASAVLIFLPKNKKDDRTTKFFEYLPLRKPYLVIADKGEVSEFVESNQLGFVLGSHEGQLEKILKQLEDQTFAFNNEMEIRPYSLANVTHQLMEEFK